MTLVMSTSRERGENMAEGSSSPQNHGDYKVFDVSDGDVSSAVRGAQDAQRARGGKAVATEDENSVHLLSLGV